MFYVKLAWRNIWRNKRRTLITVASVLFAVFFAVIMRSMQLGSYDNMVRNVVGFYTGYAQIHKAGYWDEQSLDNSMETTDSLEQQILAHPDVEELIPRLESFALLAFHNKTRGVMVVGVDSQKERSLTRLDEKIVEGNYFTRAKNQILITSDLARSIGCSPGDTIILLGQGFQGVSAAGKFIVAGIVKFNNPELNKRFVFMPLEQCQWFFNAENRVSALIVMTQPDRVERVVADLKASLGADYEVMDWKTMLPELVQAIEVDSIGGIIILCILYLIVGFGIFGTVLMMTAERKHEFGVLIAVGMQRLRLLKLLLLESIALITLGVISGIIVSLPVTIYFYFNPIPLSGQLAQVSESYGLEPVLPFSIEPRIFLYQALAVLVIGFLVTIYPLINAIRIHPPEAIKS